MAIRTETERSPEPPPTQAVTMAKRDIIELEWESTQQAKIAKAPYEPFDPQKIAQGVERLSVLNDKLLKNRNNFEVARAITLYTGYEHLVIFNRLDTTPKASPTDQAQLQVCRNSGKLYWSPP